VLPFNPRLCFGYIAKRFGGTCCFHLQIEVSRLKIQRVTSYWHVVNQTKDEVRSSLCP